MVGAALALMASVLVRADAAGPAAAGLQTPSVQTPAARTTEPAAGYVGQETCLVCHDDMGATLSATPHGRERDPRSPAGRLGCESCHGPGQAHVDGGGDPALIRSYTALAPREANDSCLACHNRGAHALWSGSMHDRRNLACVSCHSVHASKSEAGLLKTTTGIETCAGCREGAMTCTTCHNPHGSTNVRLLATGNWINESCVGCHAEKRGPFLWEHAAGRESCVSCHDPHGSSNDRMLIARLPMLCQRCHIGTRHPSTIYDGAATGTSNRLFSRSCVNCHQNIHGSNHPSGHAFLR
jgi:DmsE family decaheme c-type cytochrome